MLQLKKKDTDFKNKICQVKMKNTSHVLNICHINQIHTPLFSLLLKLYIWLGVGVPGPLKQAQTPIP